MLCVLSLVCFHNFHSLQRYKHDVLASSEGLIGPLDHPEGKIDFRRCSCTQTYKKHAAMRNFWNSALTKELLAFVDSKQPSLILPFPSLHFLFVSLLFTVFSSSCCEEKCSEHAFVQEDKKVPFVDDRIKGEWWHHSQHQEYRSTLSGQAIVSWSLWHACD